MVVVTKNRLLPFLKGILQFLVFVSILGAVAMLYLYYFSDWKIYANKALGVEFKYPREMTLIENEGRIILLHQIHYKNNGGCDLLGDKKLYDKLTDFQMSFELTGQKEKLDYVDGGYSAGSLKGEFQYQGAEGCGDTDYYFPLASTTQVLLVRRANIQILSGVRNNTEEREEILTIPDVISKEKNDQYFQQILSSFKYNPPVPKDLPGNSGSEPTGSHSTTTPISPPVPAQPTTGIKGKVMLGPTCPVEKYPPDPRCADKPFATLLVITTADGGKVVKRFSSDQKGNFIVDIAPGQYDIRSSANVLPYCSSGIITVKADRYTDIVVSCDTGIR